MKPLYTNEEYNLAKSEDYLNCECYHCSSSFKVMKKQITHELKSNKNYIQYCSPKCFYEARSIKILVECSSCSKSIERTKGIIKKSKTKRFFCNCSCAAIYNNAHKTHGIRRSKLEIWLEIQLGNLYPDLEIVYNRKDIINSELDIYIPSLNIAFELNGIFHYEPIYGVNQLNKIQNNDNFKFKACFDAKIDLCVIDTSSQKYFKPSSSKKYLDIIIKIINTRLR